MMGCDNIYDRTIKCYHTMTRSERKAADYMLKHKPDLQRMTISELAAVCGVGEATLTRFCRTLGCKGFNDFRLATAQAVAQPQAGETEEEDLYGEVQAPDSIEVKSQKLCHIGMEALRQTLALLDPAAIRKAVDLLWESKSVYCFGQGNSSIVAMDAWGRFTPVTPKFHWISDAHMQADTAAILGEGDVVLYFSFSGATRELVEVARLVQDTPGKLILVTRYPNSPGAALADLLLICGANEGPRQQGSIAAKIGQLFIIDVLFNEFCSRDVGAAARNRDRTLNATTPKLL